MFPMPHSDPVQNYSLNRKQKKANFAWRSRRLASRKLARPMLQVRLASRRLVRTLSAFFPAMRPCSHKEPFFRPRGSGKLFPPNHRMEEFCQQRSPKWLQDWWRHYDQDERQFDAALHWGHDKAGTAESVRKTWSTRFLRTTSASTCSSRMHQDEVRVL